MERRAAGFPWVSLRCDLERHGFVYMGTYRCASRDMTFAPSLLSRALVPELFRLIFRSRLGGRGSGETGGVVEDGGARWANWESSWGRNRGPKSQNRTKDGKG